MASIRGFVIRVSPKLNYWLAVITETQLAALRWTKQS